MRETLRGWRGWLKYYAPVALWIAVIFAFSTGSFSSEVTGGFIERWLRYLLPGVFHRLTESQL
ncbi:MAG: hypothetical protein QHJ73_08145, partial [Armatimonadota bacterium]|nr:hypothetical protein [Armatimonadota bacterium]